MNETNDGYNATRNQMLRVGEMSPDAQKWDGWGTALKPATEPICVARKPLSEKSVAANVLKWGTGGINIDACRVGDEITTTVRNGNSGAHGRFGKDDRVFTRQNPPGRFPANLIHDGTPDFPNDSQRFFYCAKASKADRDDGLDHMTEQAVKTFQTANGTSGKASSLSEGRDTSRKNTHPTVKPTELMSYLCRLVTPPGGLIIDPFMGSGSTGRGAMVGGFRFIGIELDPVYVEIAQHRIDALLI